MTRHPASWLLAPYHAAALATGAKSFRDNPFIGSERLNRLGLHVTRMRLAARMAEFRRHRLAGLISNEDAASFNADGFVIKENFLARDSFESIRREIRALAAPARETIQGDAVTRRIALDEALLATLPETRGLVRSPQWLGLIRYVGSSKLKPRLYVQSVFSRVRQNASTDPQTDLHADTFHATVKAWYFLTDVAEDDGPFIYVPGSHRLTPRRLAWERQGSISAARDAFLTARGSPRITADTLGYLGLGQPRIFAVPANTLVVADTMGFHARGRSLRPSMRVELWAYGRRNPFLPWIGFDPAAAPFLRGRVETLLWRALDVRERLGLGGNHWREAGIRHPEEPPDLAVFGLTH